MSVNKKKFCLVGLPKSGKSTFIAALWHVVEAKELSNSLQISTLPNNRQYLEKLREAWLTCEDISRTSMESISHIELDVIDKTTNNNALFSFPDVKGELFKQLFETREIPVYYLDLLKESDGVLLFIGDQIKNPLMISEFEEMFDDEPPESPQSWKHEMVPTQVVLVDLIQSICDVVKKPLNVAIIISAWDKQIAISEAIGERINPEQWMKKTIPLFHQFISTNNNQLKWTCFGISAQGGDYIQGKTELISLELQSCRLKVQEGSSKDISHDISAPIKWLINSKS